MHTCTYIHTYIHIQIYIYIYIYTHTHTHTLLYIALILYVVTVATRNEITHKNTKYRQLVKNKKQKKTKDKSCPCTSYEVIHAQGSTVPLILNLSLRWKWERIPSAY